MKFESTNYPPTKYSKAVTKQIEGRLDVIRLECRVTKCICCGEELDFDHFDMYDHSGGVGIVAGVPKQWLSVHCDNCNYDVSIWKLRGIK